jgi:glycosyltransferase involved in cell wall biosynthesis
LRVVHIITGLNQGGAESVLHRLVSAANPGKIEHIVISMMDQGVYGPRIANAGVAVHALQMPRGRLTAGGILKLYRLLRSLAPDVVQTWMYHADLVGGVVARLAGCRNVVWGIRHSDLDRDKTSRKTRLVARLSAALSDVVPLAIACCSERAVLVHQALGYSKTRFSVVPNGYDLSLFCPDLQAGAALRRHWGVNPDEMLLGYVARWDPQKDHANLLRALALLAGKLPRLRSVLVGSGIDPGNAQLMTLINENGLAGRVVLAGQRNDIPAVMNAIDLHVLASAYGEAFPNVVAEAMACGTPCVVTDVGDAALIVGSTGLVVPPGDAEALAAAIDSLASEWRDASGRLLACKEASRRRIVESFGIEKMVSAYQTLWENVRSGRFAASGGTEQK